MAKRSNPDQPTPVEEIMADIEKIIDTQIEVILRRAEKINEGNNGIICLINIKDIPELEALRKTLGKREINLDQKQAIKILKIYKPGTGQKEFELQKKAHEILTAANVANTARIPSPIMFRDVAIETATQDRLNTMGSKSNSNRAEVIIMDYIPGDDLATFLFREAVKMLPNYADNPESVDQYDFQSLYRILSEELKFVVPDRSKANMEQAEQQSFEHNMNLVYKFLQQTGYTKKPEKIELLQKIETQIRNAVNLLNQNGLVLRDGHQRNFLISQQDGETQVYVIDFGDARAFTGQMTESVYEEELAFGVTKKYPHDLKVPNELAVLSERHEKKLFNPEDISKLKEKYQRSPDFQKILKKLQIKEIDLETASKLILGKVNSFQNTAEGLVALIFVTLELNLTSKEEATEVLRTHLEKSIGEKKNLLVKALQSL
ncbi:MAG: phosphotransferase [Candidatus Magasanikbacteria bacterium]|nr:phosphotransferase [Candidatus Magasanikbacteria bacterium]